MTLAELLPLVLRGSIALMVFSVGLGTPMGELTHLVRHPGQMARSLLAMNLIMPVIAVAAVKLFGLDRSVAITLVVLSLSPAPPMLPGKLIKAGGDHAYVMGLLFTASALAIVWIPLACAILDRLFPATINVPPAAIAPVVLTSVLGPMIAGAAVRMLARNLAERLSKPLSAAANVLTLLAVLALVAMLAPDMLEQIGNGVLIASAGFVVLGLIVGHLLGGPGPNDRTVLAVATAARHPGIAIVIAQINFPDARAAPATAVIYLLVSAALTFRYLFWRKRGISPRAPPRLAGLARRTRRAF